MGRARKFGRRFSIVQRRWAENWECADRLDALRDSEGIGENNVARYDLKRALEVRLLRFEIRYVYLCMEDGY